MNLLAPLYLVLWSTVDYDCPWGAGKAPLVVKAVICTAVVTEHELVTRDLVAARAALRSARPAAERGPRLLVIEPAGPRARRKSLDWYPVVQ